MQEKMYCKMDNIENELSEVESKNRNLAVNKHERINTETDNVG